MLRLVGRGGGGIAHHVRALATFGPPSVNGPSQKVKFKAPHKRYDERVSISHPVTNHRVARFSNHPTNLRAPPPNPPSNRAAHIIELLNREQVARNSVQKTFPPFRPGDAVEVSVRC